MHVAVCSATQATWWRTNAQYYGQSGLSLATFTKILLLYRALRETKIVKGELRRPSVVDGKSITDVKFL